MKTSLSGQDPDATARAFATRDAQRAVAHLLECLGQDTRREGLKDTPKRVVAYLERLLLPEPFEFTTFSAEGMSEMITVDDISFYSLCEHHMLPFFGRAVVGYIPDGKILGLSKLPRCVDACASGLQNQERITQAIATAIEQAVQPKGVGVWMRGRHLCMEMRGVKKKAKTTTSCLRGVILDDPKARAEFIALTGGRR